MVVRIFSISKDFPERQGRETEIYVVQLVVRIFPLVRISQRQDILLGGGLFLRQLVIRIFFFIYFHAEPRRQER